MDEQMKSRFTGAAYKIIAAEAARIERAKREADEKLKASSLRKAYQEEWETRVLPLLAKAAAEATEQMGPSVARVAVAGLPSQLPRIGEASLQLFLGGAQKATATLRFFGLGTGHVQFEGSSPVPFAKVTEQFALHVVASFVESNLP